MWPNVTGGRLTRVDNMAGFALYLSFCSVVLSQSSFYHSSCSSGTGEPLLVDILAM